MTCYRVWMKDGYAGLYSGENKQEAERKAVEYAVQSIKGAAMTAHEKEEATSVDYSEQHWSPNPKVKR